ncbi:MAG: outer membrane lipid asymmetry maintenance protein MlaD [Micavibrio aeruginosavorus]|uniref:Outer membrane lipid asymmetry maintenance protein MlaD n=1 Tax=Micavibrio aeruginosavorus TaxID=349221 RepID=A0A2W5N7L6_9BACT|nr:MAG: outer membrane lipid asymmetry maintenance protein MlaD [Micavibrio aeruginosavorus]
MKRNVIETVLGAVVLLVAVVFLGFSYSSANVGNVSGYRITADFSGIGGLGVGDSVQISGVKIGSISKIDLKPDDYMARVTMEIDNSIKLPDDTSAFISSESLLGGKYMELQPGSSEDMLGKDGHIEYTQAPQNLEQLLGKFIFSMDKKDGADSSSAAPAEASPSHP